MGTAEKPVTRKFYETTIPYPNRPAVTAFACEVYGALTCKNGVSRWLHAVTVADKAESLIHAHYLGEYGLILPMQQMHIDSVYCAGLLHDSIKYCGVSFEDIVFRANLVTATAVSAVSSDHRLPGPLRIREHVGRLAEADIHAQIVKLCSLWHNLEEAVELFRTIEKKDAKDILRDWLVECDLISDALHLVKHADATSKTYRWVEHAIKELTRACDKYAQRETILANMQARLEVKKKRK